MKNLLGLKNYIEKQNDLILYNFIAKKLNCESLEKEVDYLATEIYESTIRYFYEYSESDILVKKAINRLINIDDDSFPSIIIMALYSSSLKSKNGSLLASDNRIKGSKVSNKSIKYIMAKVGYYEYVLYMLALSEELGISNNFIEAMINYFNKNKKLIKSELIRIDTENHKNLMLDRCINTKKII